MFLILMYVKEETYTFFHALLDYSVGQFYDDGRQATKDILNRGRVPIVTGGTGLYLRWYGCRLYTCLVALSYNVKSNYSILQNLEFIHLHAFVNVRFMYGKPDVPKPSPEVIAEAHDMLVGFQTEYNWDAAVELVVNAGDPKASSLPRNDWYRLRRSLEILKVWQLLTSTVVLPL